MATPVSAAGTRRTGPPGAWKFSLHASVAKIHRWDLTERSDNPGVSLNLKGLWDVAAGEAYADSLTLDLPHSHSKARPGSRPPECPIGICASRIPASRRRICWRGTGAFQPDVAEALDAKQLLKRVFPCAISVVLGRCPNLQRRGRTSLARLRKTPSHRPGVRRGPQQFLRIAASSTLHRISQKEALTKPEKPAAKLTVATAASDQLEFRFRDDFIAGKGSLRVTGKLDDASDFFKAAAALGQTLNRGWEIAGGASEMSPANGTTASPMGAGAGPSRSQKRSCKPPA